LDVAATLVKAVGLPPTQIVWLLEIDPGFRLYIVIAIGGVFALQLSPFRVLVESRL
jgi:hypothetical protein